MLLENGADPKLKCDKCYTALHYAARDGHSQLIPDLLLHGSDIDSEVSGLISKVIMVESVPEFIV